MNYEDFRSPGQLIEALLEERDWTQRLLAIILGEYETGINKIITNKKSVTAKLALRLGEVFNVPPEQFMKLQQIYDLAQARHLDRPDPDRATRAAIFGGWPVADMIKRGWIDVKDIRDVHRVEQSLIKFFGAKSVNDIEILLTHSARKTETFTPVTSAQLAWIYRARQIAREMLVARYSPGAVRKAVGLLSNLLSAPVEARKVPRILTECGIRFVIVESLPSAKIDGVCFWLNDLSPVIGMSLRYDRIDNFWFVLRHELEHVLQRHGQKAMMVDAELEGERAGTGANIAEEECIANKAATEFCIPQQQIDAFVARKAPFFNEMDIIGMARTLQIHPGLIVGQLQHRTGRYDFLRKHLAKMRCYVSPGAMVDGWGNTYPVTL